jgi:hypothetical protein
VGTCAALEKRYLRLTSAPDPASVRPDAVLRAAYAQLYSTWRATRDTNMHNYLCVFSR